MYAEISSAIASLKTMSDVIGLLVNMKVDTAVREKAIELQFSVLALQSSILSIQTQNQELLEENKQLKQRLIDMEQWDEEAQKYALSEMGGRREKLLRKVFQQVTEKKRVR